MKFQFYELHDLINMGWKYQYDGTLRTDCDEIVINEHMIKLCVGQVIEVRVCGSNRYKIKDCRYFVSNEMGYFIE